MLQPLGGRTASSILAEEIISQFIDPKGPNCIASLSPGIRTATLERWAQIGKDYSRLQRTFFDTCRSEVEKGELADLLADFKAFQVRLEQESVALKSRPSDGEGTATRSMIGSMLSSMSSMLKSSEPRTKAERSLDKSEKSLDKSDKSLDKSSSGERSGSLPSAEKPVVEKELPLSVHVAVSENNVAKLQVDLVAAATFLSWVVERNWTEFKELYASLKRYKVWVPVLPKSLDGPKLEAWLVEVLRVAQLSASREVYAFLKIGNTVDLLAQAARTKRSTIAVLKPAEEGDDLAALSSDDLAKALDNLALLEEPAPFEPRPELPHVKSDGSVRARKVAEGGSDVSAEDIAAALRHLLSKFDKVWFGILI